MPSPSTSTTGELPRRMSAKDFVSMTLGELPQFSTTAKPGTASKQAAKSRRRTEHQEQCEVIDWAYEHECWTPGMEALALLHAIPNGGARSKAAAGKLKAEGVKKGVSDLYLPVARGGYHGLYIEMKAVDGRPSPEQREWMSQVIGQGYCAEVCYGADAAKELLTAYMAGKIQHGGNKKTKKAKS